MYRIVIPVIACTFSAGIGMFAGILITPKPEVNTWAEQIPAMEALMSERTDWTQIAPEDKEKAQAFIKCFAKKLAIVAPAACKPYDKTKELLTNTRINCDESLQLLAQGVQMSCSEQ